MISFEEAQATLLSSVVPLGAERVGLHEALGRVLAEDLVAEEAIPAFDQSSMDGYAVATSDLMGTLPITMPLVGESAAGGVTPDLVPGSTCRIFTGARLPRGADAVVMQEDVLREGDRVVFKATPAPGAWIRRRGDDLMTGAPALSRGVRLGPGQVALAAALDRPELAVRRRPTVTILASGDELRSVGLARRPGSLAESNSYFVAAAARQAGAIARVAPFVRDDLASATLAVAEALRGSDVVVTIGGVSVGDRDVVRPAMERAGVTLDFYKVRMKPGKPLVVGRAGGTHVLGLPGNPASASLTFLLFGVPLLRTLQGDGAALPRSSWAVVGGSLERRAGRKEFLRATLDTTANPPVVRVLPNQASGAVTSLARADALIILEADRERLREGEAVEVIRLSDV